jgi:hypothetical protein
MKSVPLEVVIGDREPAIVSSAVVGKLDFNTI